MIQRISALLHKQYTNINAAAFMLAGFTFLGQLVGLVRDRMLAGRIGPGDTLDIYVTAFQIPDLVFALGAALVSVTILIPFISELVHNDTSKEEAKEFINSIFTTFLWGMVIVSVILYFLMPWLAPLVAPGFDAHLVPELVRIARIMLLSPILMGMSNLFGSITQMQRKFFVYALSPILYNIGIIAGIVFLYPIYGVSGLAYGVIIGSFLHMAIQVPVVLRHGFAPELLLRNIQWKRVGRVMAISLPRTLTLAFTQIVVTVLIAFATKIGEGAASIFRFALTINTFPVIIIGISYSVAAFPQMVELFQQNKIKEFITTVMKPARSIIFWSLPMIVLFIVLRAQIVRVILGTGEFTWSDTRMTAAVLAILVVSVAARGLVGLIVRGYYAAGKTWRPLVINAISTLLTIGFAALGLYLYAQMPSFSTWLETTLRVTQVAHARLLMLALAYSLGNLINGFVLWILFKKEFVARENLITASIYQSIIGSVLMGVIAYVSLQIFAPILNLNTFMGVFFHGLIAGVIAIIIGFLFLILVKNNEILDLFTSIREKIRQS